MSKNKTKPTNVTVETYLSTVEDSRRTEAEQLIKVMHEITRMPAVMWGPSIIGFGSMHYKYESGREGDMPQLAFSPRKAALTVYFEGFDNYKDLLQKLGKHKTSVACLYIKKLEDVNLDVLKQMLTQSFVASKKDVIGTKFNTVEEYVNSIPDAARSQFNQLRALVKDALPNATEIISYNTLGYKIEHKRARVYISGWNDHVAMYPTPNDKALQKELEPYIKGKGTLWFPLNTPLPADLIKKAVRSLAS